MALFPNRLSCHQPYYLITALLNKTTILQPYNTNIMNRRSFVKQLGIVSIPALIAPGCLELSASPPRYRMGYQLYSIRDEMAKSPLDTLKALQAMGSQDFELYGFDDQKGSFYGYEASEFKRILDDMNLTVTSGHYVK